MTWARAGFARLETDFGGLTDDPEVILLDDAGAGRRSYPRYVGRIRGWAANAWVDAGAAGLLSVLALLSLTRPRNHDLWPLAIGLAIIATSSVAWRHRAPLVAFGVSAGATVGYQWVTRAKDFPMAETLALLLVLYTAGVQGVSRRHQADVAGLAVLMIGVCVAIVAASGSLTGATVSTDVQPPLAALALGYTVARQRSLSRQMTAAIAQLHADEELQASVAAARERNRVARELHDVVTHGVSAMVVQAGAARMTLDDEPEVARAALLEVVAAGRSAIDELHRVVTALTLKGTDDAPPPVGLAGVPALVEGWRAAGQPVELAVVGHLLGLPDPVDAAGYRVVQEALTNVVKHAPGAGASVSVVVGEGAIEVRVSNGPAPEPAAVAPPRSGHGLVGMAERVEGCGGRLTYGPRPEGGFAVHARMPLAEAVSSAPTPGLDRIRSWGAWPGVLVALVGLCGDAALSGGRRGSLLLNLGLCAAMAGLLVMRRAFPFWFLVAVNVAAFPISNGLTSIDKSTLVSTYVFAVPVWAVAGWSETGPAAAGLVAAIGFEIAEAVHWHLGGGSVVGNAVVCGALWAAGRLWRRQRRVATDLVDARARLEAGQRARSELSLAGARAEMVGQLDGLVVARVETMVAVAASVAESVPASNRPSSGRQIEQIESAGRDALARLREILGLLRAVHDPEPLSPSLGVEQLDRLIGDFGGPSHPARFVVTGTPVPLTGGVDLVVYRVIVDVLAHADCERVELHFATNGRLRIRFEVARAGAAASDRAIRAEVEQAGGSIERSPQEIVAEIPLIAVAFT